MRRNSNFDLSASVDADVDVGVDAHSTTKFHSRGVEETKDRDHIQNHRGVQQHHTEHEEKQEKRSSLQVALTQSQKELDYKVLEMVSSPSKADLNLELSGDIEMVARFVPTILVQFYLDKARRDSTSDVRPSKCQL